MPCLYTRYDDTSQISILVVVFLLLSGGAGEDRLTNPIRQADMLLMVSTLVPDEPFLLWTNPKNLSASGCNHLADTEHAVTESGKKS